MFREAVNEHVRERAAGDQHDDARLSPRVPVAHLLIPLVPRRAAALPGR